MLSQTVGTCFHSAVPGRDEEVNSLKPKADAKWQKTPLNLKKELHQMSLAEFSSSMLGSLETGHAPINESAVENSIPILSLRRRRSQGVVFKRWPESRPAMLLYPKPVALGSVAVSSPARRLKGGRPTSARQYAFRLRT